MERELRRHEIVLCRTRFGEPGVMMYNTFTGRFVDDFHSTRKTSIHIPYDIHVLGFDIKEKDWFYDMWTLSIDQANQDTDSSAYGKMKIVASTDKSVSGLPGLSKEFVMNIIEMDNNGNFVGTVFLEYEHIGNQSYEIEEGKTDDYPIYDIKVDKNNNVIAELKQE